MGLFGGDKVDKGKDAALDKRLQSSKFRDVHLKSAGEVMVDIYKSTSGTSEVRKSDFNIFYNIIAFKGVKDGVGVSTLVANTAYALADLGLTVCVIDTSIKAPSQDYLLKTNYAKSKSGKTLDWFDMPFTKDSVVNISKVKSGITVLSFTNRTILDLVSLNDNATLVDIAIEKLQNKYDIILIDVCDEPSAVGNACMLRAGRIFQVWGNAPQEIGAIQGFVTNQLTCCVPLDKMKFVITSNTVDDISTEWEVLLKKYKFKHVAHVGKSMEIARRLAAGKIVYGEVTDNEDIAEFTECIKDICENILGVTFNEDGTIKKPEKKSTGKLTVSKISNGEVEGTLTAKMKKKDKESSLFEEDLINGDTQQALDEMSGKKRGFFGRRNNTNDEEI